MTTVTLAAVHFAKRSGGIMMAVPTSSRVGQGGSAMFNVAPCNTALAVLIVLAALGPAIVDMARLAKCAFVPCRNKERV